MKEKKQKTKNDKFGEMEKKATNNNNTVTVCLALL